MADSTLRQRLSIAAKAAVGVFSDNASKAAYGMLSGIWPGAIGQPPARGTREFLRAYGQMPWLRAVSSRVATGVATVEWQLHVAKKPDAPKSYQAKMVQRASMVERRKLLKQMQEQGEMKQITDHPILDLLQDANSMQTGFEMRKVTQLHLDLAGEAFWLKERAGNSGALNGAIIGLWPIPPDWILNTPTPQTRMFRVGFRAWRGLIPDTEFIWMRDPDPSNPYGRGSGVSQSLTDELETDEYAAKHSKAFFYNQAKPDILVYPKQGSMRDPDVKRLEDDWVSRNTGFWKAFKPYFLNREVGVTQFEQNFRAMQFVQLRQFERDAIVQTFGMPPELLGILSASNRATITAADLLFNRYVVEPRLELLRGIWQERLIPEFDERLILDYVSPVQSDKDFELEVAKSAPWMLSMDEWRDMGGKGPMDDETQGRLRAIPSTYALKDLDDPNALAPAPMPPGFHPDTGAPLAPVGPDGKPVQQPAGPKPNDEKPPKPADQKPPKPQDAKPPKPPSPSAGSNTPGGDSKAVTKPKPHQDQAVAICSSMFDSKMFYRVADADFVPAVGRTIVVGYTTLTSSAEEAHETAEAIGGRVVMVLGADNPVLPDGTSLDVVSAAPNIILRVR